MPIMDKRINAAIAGITEPAMKMRGKIRQGVKNLSHARAVGVATIDGWSLEHASPAMRADKQVVLASVRSDGRSIRYASDALRNDREVVLAAVGNQGLALKYASDALREDFEVGIEALRSNSDAYFCAGEELRNDKQFKHVSQNIFNDNRIR